MILNTTLKTIEVILGTAKTTNDCEINADFTDTVSGSTFVPTSLPTVSNGTTAVTVVPAPAASTQRHVKGLSIYNADTVSQTVTVRSFDGTNRRRIVVTALPPAATLYWVEGQGWQIIGTGTTLDFRTGTWTPFDASGAGLVFTGVSANYTKLGNMVFADFQLTFPATANGANNTISGLPFANTSDNSSRQGNITFPGSATGAKFAVIGIGPLTTFNLFDANASLMLNSALSTLTIIGSMHYRTAA